MQRPPRTNIYPLLAAILFAAGCTSSGTTQSQNYPDRDNASFSNFLVIGIAGNYDSRAQFERTVVSGLRFRGSSASAYYVVAGGNKPITREAVKNAIDSGGFDAVVVTRVLDRDEDVSVKDTVTGTKATTKGGSLVNLFRYDYEDMDEPMSLDIKSQATFSVELYSAASEEMVWSFELVSSRSDNVGKIVDETAATVVNRLERDDLIAR